MSNIHTQSALAEPGGDDGWKRNRDAEIALRIVQKFLCEPGRRVRIDVPGEQADFLRRLLQLGFKEVLVSPVMVRGGHALPGQRSHLYGIADPAFG